MSWCKKIVSICALGAGACSCFGAETATFTLHKALDTNGTNHVALTYLIPKGWKANDSVTWDLNRRTAPMEFTIATVSPDGKFATSFLNAVAFTYNRTPQKVTGRMMPNQPTDLIVDSFRQSHPGIDIQVVDRQETPVQSKFQNSSVMHSRALKCLVKLRFVQNGVTMFSKSAFDFDGYDAGTPFGFANGYTQGAWQLTNVSAVTGPEAEFPKAMRLGGVVLSSWRYDPEFYQQYAEIVQMIIREMQAQNQARIDAEFAEMRQKYHEFQENFKKDFDAQEDLKEQHTRDFCDYVLGQQRFTDGKTEMIMPAGYDRAVTNGTDYILTNDANYAAGGDYRELTKVPLAGKG